MAFIDEIKLNIKAGVGGNGVVRVGGISKEKNILEHLAEMAEEGLMCMLKAVRDLSILARYKNVKNFEGEDGEGGMKDSKHGKNGKDLVIDLPIGSAITNLNTGRKNQPYQGRRNGAYSKGRERRVRQRAFQSFN